MLRTCLLKLLQHVCLLAQLAFHTQIVLVDTKRSVYYIEFDPKI